MSPLNAFLATWTRARDTFGQNPPIGGAQFDHSARLRQLQSDVQSAAPGSHWQGEAAAAYAAANNEHAQVFGTAADLDSRLAAEVDKSAQSVADGRAALDGVRDWVIAAASSVPDNAAGRTMMMPIVSRGIGQVGEILQKSNSVSNAIAAQLQQIGAEYHALNKQRFANAAAPLPQNPPEEPGPPEEDVTTWYAEWEALSNEVRANNAALAAHLRVKPPPNSPALAAWNAQLATINANSRRLYEEQLIKVAEAVDLGIQVQTPTPPVVVENPEDVPQGAVPASLTAPGAHTADNREKRLPS